MTFLHLLTLALGVLGALAACDLLQRRGVGPWPVGLLALALVPLAGWFYSPWLAAAALGAAIGVGVRLAASGIRVFLGRRRVRREQARARQEARDRQLERARR